MKKKSLFLLMLSLFFSVGAQQFTLLDTIPLCLVTVDSNSTHTIIYWEKGTVTGYDSVRIYKKIAGTIYNAVGTVAFNDTGEFHDFSVNPNINDEFYKLAGVTPLGLEGPRSRFHRTIHISNLGTGLLAYNEYEIENVTNPSPFYELYRDDLGSGTWGSSAINSMPSGFTQMNDGSYGSFPAANYRVQTSWAISCDPSRAIVNTSRSNIKNQATVEGIEDHTNLNVLISITQNFSSNSIQLTLKNAVLTLNSQFLLYDETGRLIKTEVMTTGQNSATMSLAGLSDGVYFAMLTNKNLRFSKKVIVLP
ncbi:MAG: T9SS type A sorting domain-containing protein [Bacteroidia bacterium]|nr:T9SS type A sorting domain-containing protein [Bacteroidia bacterium]